MKLANRGDVGAVQNQAFSSVPPEQIEYTDSLLAKDTVLDTDEDHFSRLTSHCNFPAAKSHRCHFLYTSLVSLNCNFIILILLLPQCSVIGISFYWSLHHWPC